MKTTPLEPNARIGLVDALRGSALMGILLLHSIEHWDFLKYPEASSRWMQVLNTWTREIGYFLFGGKAYAIFAMLFGVSFYLILDRWSRRGIPFRGRFLWRLAVLAIFGYVNGIIYCGDILLIIAILGVPLVCVYRLGNRALAWIAIALLLQIPTLVQTGRAFFDTDYSPSHPRHWAMYGELFQVFSGGSFLDVISINAGRGQFARLWWTVEVGRDMQMLGLFVVGFLIGRSRVFEDLPRAARLAKHALLWGLVLFAVLYPVKLHLDDWGLAGMKLYHTDRLVSAYCNLAQLAVWTALFAVAFRYVNARKTLSLLEPYGRMSLTCYVTQGWIGVPLFYGFGLGWYQYLGPFHSVLVGFGIFLVQCAFAHGWLKRFSYGPLEWLWRSFTFLSFATPMRKRKLAPAPAKPEVPAGIAS